MMSELDQLYQEVILDHYKQPRNFGALERPDRSVDGVNPLCGDRITVQLKLAGDTVEDIRFTGTGCAISQASASLMTETVKGKTAAEVRGLFEQVHRVITGQPADPHGERLGKLEVFSGVSAFPVRVKCASLAWHTMKAALDGAAGGISTE